MLGTVLMLVYLVFMFGIPLTTEKVWIDSVCSVQTARRRVPRIAVPVMAPAAL
jgi:hypothetical protein